MTEVQKSRRRVNVSAKKIKSLKKQGNKRIRQIARIQLLKGEEVFTCKLDGFSNRSIT